MSFNSLLGNFYQVDLNVYICFRILKTRLLLPELKHAMNDVKGNAVRRPNKLHISWSKKLPLVSTSMVDGKMSQIL